MYVSFHLNSFRPNYLLL